MNHHCIVRTRENRLYNFYYEENYIHVMQYETNGWIRLEPTVKNAQKQFSCYETQDGNLYLFVRDLDGNLKICLFDGNTLREKMMKKAGETPLSCFYAAVNGGKITLLYAMAQNQNNQILAYQTFENGLWGQPQRIDSLLPLKNAPFYIHKVSGTHYIIFYRNTQDCTLGYREFSTDGRLGQYQIFHSSNAQLVDHSFLTASDHIHMLYILRGLFSTQLVYRNKSGEQLSAPVVLWESPQMESCCLFADGQIVWACWMHGSHLYYVKSEDYGKSFQKPARYQDAIAKRYYKAEYITNRPFYGNELYIAGDNPQGILFLPKALPNFYPLKEEKTLQEAGPAAPKAEDPVIMTQKQLEEAQKALELKTMALMQRQQENKPKENATQLLEERFEKQITIFTQKTQSLQEELAQQKKAFQQLEQENSQIKVVLEELKNLIETKLTPANHPQPDEIIILPEEKRMLLEDMAEEE